MRRRRSRKTVTAAAMIAQRGVNTLVLVHRRELLDQWRERLQSFLALDAREIGTIGGGKSKATGRIDVAMLQSVATRWCPRRVVAALRPCHRR
ncbi:DEAD/DEAH box helicase family protein [Paraburkholderia sp. BR10954]|uniref:DEAD/DEAH box helicase family protein n=1 Tax=Paraburkholderia sp. BR10954 TaxID=3236995 RepID=UPI0034D18DF8